jgi:hypothetical protein
MIKSKRLRCAGAYSKCRDKRNAEIFGGETEESNSFKSLG